MTILDLVTVHQLRGWRRVLVLIFWYWLPIKRAALVSVISEYTKKDLLHHINVDHSKVRVVHCLLLPPTSSPLLKNSTLRDRLFFKSGQGQNKNVERVLQALQGILCHLRVIGDLDASQISVLRQYGIDYSSVSNISDEQVVDEFCRCDMLVFVCALRSGLLSWKNWRSAHASDCR